MYKIKTDELILYHGTAEYFKAIDLGKAKPFKDFGRGFYLTTSYRQAIEWAERKADVVEGRIAFVFRYNVDADSISDDYRILELLEYRENWLDVVVASRIDKKENDFDIIYDRMADGDLENILRKYKNNSISATLALSSINKWRGEYKRDQYCFKTNRACELLERTKTIECIKKNGMWEVLP